MIGYLIAFWLGVGVCYGFIFFSTHPDDRSKLFSHVKALFHKDG